MHERQERRRGQRSAHARREGQRAPGQRSCGANARGQRGRQRGLHEAGAWGCCQVLHCSVQKAQHVLRPIFRGAWVPPLKMARATTNTLTIIGGEGVGVGGGGCAWWEAFFWSTHLQYLLSPALRADVWGSTRVLGVSPKGRVGAACVCWECLKNGRGKKQTIVLGDTHTERNGGL